MDIMLRIFATIKINGVGTFLHKTKENGILFYDNKFKYKMVSIISFCVMFSLMILYSLCFVATIMLCFCGILFFSSIVLRTNYV